MPVSADEARRELARRELARRRQQPAQGGGSSRAGHREFNIEDVPNRERGTSRATASLSGFVEGIPIAGPYLQAGVENVSAGIGSMLTGRPQGEVRGEMRDMVEESQAGHPWFTIGGNVAGGIAGTAPAVMAAPGAFGAGAGPLLARTAAGTASGAAIGGADAGVRHGVDAIPVGAVVGGVLGGAAPAISDAVGAGARALFNRGSRVTPAQQHLARAAGADAVDDAGTVMRQLGPDAMPMDLGPNLQRQAGALAAMPGKAQQQIRSAVATRQGAAGQRVASSLDDTLGQAVDTVAVADDIIARRTAAARPLYDRAYQEGADGIITPEIRRMAGSKMFSDAMRRAAETGQDRAVVEGYGAFNPRVNITNDGRIQFGTGRGVRQYPDLQYWDYVKRELDDIAGAARRAGRKGEADVAAQMAKKLRGELDNAVPSYREAREAFSGPAAILESLEEGQQVFSRSLTPNQLRVKIARMGEAEREAFVQGARAEVARNMGTARNDALKARQMFDTGWNKEKLEILLGKDQATRMLQTLDSEAAFTRTRDVVTSNSETAAREAAKLELTPPDAPRLRGLLNPLRWGDTAADAAESAVRGSRTASQARVNEELSGLLTSRDPQTIQRTIQTVQAAQRRGDITAQRAREIIQSLAVGPGQRQITGQ